MKRLLGILLGISALVLATGCEWLHHEEPDTKEFDNLVIVCQAGYLPGTNNLSSFLMDNTEALKRGYVPTKKDPDALILISHLSLTEGKVSAPCVVRMYKKNTRRKNTTVVMDTVKVYSEFTTLTKTPTLDTVLTWINENYPARTKGLVFSSHGTGWLPQGYYGNPRRFDPDYRSGDEIIWADVKRTARPQFPPVSEGVPHIEYPYIDGIPVRSADSGYVDVPVRSLGTESGWNSSGNKVDFEIEPQSFRDCFPFRFDYMILDACLMGGVEVAYQLRDICGKVVFSQAEILADGMVYDTMMEHLCKGKTPDLLAVAQDFFDHYNTKSGVYRSCTVSCVDCGRMVPLANLCRELFSVYADEMASVIPSSVQSYFRSGKHWFYDLRDIMVQAGASEDDLKRLDAALSQCVLYKEATPTMLKGSNGFDIRTHCGLSMYLPCNGGDYLDARYKELDWNEATALVK
ncbi:MAG: hypothetical protein IJS07_07035 [Bacteroidales bacterium]|nr:hypothetical protein [Bacteroidales bacterium]